MQAGAVAHPSPWVQGCPRVTWGCPAVGTMPTSHLEEISLSCPVLCNSFGSWKGLTAILTVTSWNQWETKHSTFCSEWSYFLHSSKKLLPINRCSKEKFNNGSWRVSSKPALGESSQDGWGVIATLGGCLKSHPDLRASHWGRSALPSVAHRHWGCEAEPCLLCA